MVENQDLDVSRRLDEMRSYLSLEVRHVFQEGFTDVQLVGSFEHDLEAKKATTTVYEVTLESGKRVFAVDGGINRSVRCVYPQDLPNAETASKCHLYTALALNPNVNRDQAEQFAEFLGLPAEYRFSREQLTSHDSDFLRIRDFLDKEVPFQLDEGYDGFELVGEFEYKVGERAFGTRVYQVTLRSGRKVFAVDVADDKNNFMSVYDTDLPDAETAGKYHVYGVFLEDEKDAEAFADSLGLPKEYRVSYTGGPIGVSDNSSGAGNLIPTVLPGDNQGSDSEEDLEDPDKWIEQERKKGDKFLTPENIERSIDSVRRYIDSLSLGFEVSYGGVKVNGMRPADPANQQPERPGEFTVPVLFKDSDGTNLMFDMWINGETFEIRHTTWDHETDGLKETDYWKPTKEQIEASMAGKKQHYVLVVTKDADTARRLTEQLYAEDAVVTAASGHRRVLDAMNSNAVVAHVHGMGSSEGPEQVLTKPEEEQRRKALEHSYIGG